MLSSPSQEEKNCQNDIQHMEKANGGIRDRELAGHGLGTLQLEVEGIIVLHPTPSNDPNDPLNFSQGYKIYLTLVACIAVFLSNYLAAGPTVDIVNIAIAYTGLPPDVPKTAYFFTASALFQGVGLFVWSPLFTKYGRRPVYVISYIGLSASVLLCVLIKKNYAVELVGRLGVGFFSGAAESLAPITITDIFFTHERGRYLAMYQTALSIGVSFGIIISGAVAQQTGSFSNIYWVGFSLISAATVLVCFSFPETAWRRTAQENTLQADRDGGSIQSDGGRTVPVKKKYTERLAIFSGTYTEENWFKIFSRPFGLLLLPAVAWGTLCFASTIGFLVAISSVFSVALGQPPYNFNAQQSGFCFAGGVVGAVLAIPIGGHLGDWVANRATHRAGGVRQPEYRLPAIIPSLITAPAGLLAFGLGIAHKVHWMVPVLGLGLLNFAIATGSNVALAYAIDVYKPIASEVVVAILGWKAVVGFALSYGTNQWIAAEGFQNAFGEMAAICAGCLLLALPLGVFGARLRKATLEWRITSWIRWSDDRDDLDIVLH
ncbi:MFS general substrate transporter [Meredithblackwellia eburnea MCA 4105]